MVDQPKRVTALDAVKMAREARAAGMVASPDLAEYDADGFWLVKNKAALVGKGFVILSTEYQDGEFREEVVITGVTNSGKAFKMRDSSTGIYRQLAAYKGDFPFGVNDGLRVSEYTGPGGTQARTYYLDDSAI